MLSIVKDIPAFSFSCQLDDFLIMADKQVSVAFSLHGREIFSSTYVPDVNQEIHFRDLCSIIEAHLEEPLQEFAYKITAAGETALNKTFTVLLCRFNISPFPDAFIESHFLSTLENEKDVTGKSVEYLYLTNGTTTKTESIAVSVKCYYAGPNHELFEDLKVLPPVPGKGICKIDVSAAQFKVDGRTLLRYVVTAGKREMTYNVSSSRAAVSLRFINNFGCEETYDFLGLVEINPNFERSSALISGKTVNYSVRKEVHLKLSGGFLPIYMMEFADDIAASKDVSLQVNNTLYPVTVVDSDTVRTNSLSELNTFSVEFVAASKRGMSLPELTRIFDDTFDKTYN